MSIINLTRVLADTRTNEGCRLTMYLDTAGVPTVGWGHNLRTPLTQAAVDGILHDDVIKALGDLTLAWPLFVTLDDVRQGAFLDMAFNLGVGGLLGFHKALAAAQAEDWATCATELADSRWYTQVGDRARWVCQLVRTGVYTAAT